MRPRVSLVLILVLCSLFFAKVKVQSSEFELKQAGLSGRAAECTCRGSLVSPFFVEAETPAMNLEEAFGGGPVFAFAPHSFAEDA